MTQQYPPAPRRRRRWPWIVGGIVAVFIVIGVAANLGGQGGTTNTPSTSAVDQAISSAQAALSSAAAPALATTTASQDTIVYTITGKKSQMIDYVVPGPGFQQSQITDTTTLPWSKTFTADATSYQRALLSLTAQNAGSGTISCSISVDGQEIASNSSTGQYAIVECQGHA